MKDFDIGTIFVLEGLKSNAILNGMKGSIISLHKDDIYKVLVAGKSLLIKKTFMKEINNPVAFSLRETMIQNEMKIYLKKKLINEDKLIATGELDMSLLDQEREEKTCSETQQTHDVHTQTVNQMLQDIQPIKIKSKSSNSELKVEKGNKVFVPEKKSSQIQNNAKRVTFKENEDKSKDKPKESHLLESRKSGLFSANSDSMFGSNSRFSTLIQKMGSLGSVQPSALNNLPHLNPTPDITKIYGLNKNSDASKPSNSGSKDINNMTRSEIANAKEGISAMIDLSVEDILKQVENWRGTEKANDPQVYQLMAIANLLKKK